MYLLYWYRESLTAGHFRAHGKRDAMAKNQAASSLASQRWKKTTKAQRKEVAQAMNASRWANATPEERSAHGQMLAESRAKAAKKKAVKKGKKK